jgi:hypothetical protein
MKTEKQIRFDLSEERKLKALKGKTVSKKLEEHYHTAIKTVQTLSIDKVKSEREKLLTELKLIESKFDSYFQNFTAFRLKNEANHKDAVRKEFNKVYELTKLKTRLKWVDYVLEI